MKFFLLLIFNWSVFSMAQNQTFLNKDIVLKLNDIAKENDVILLGESSHGVNEFNLSKIEIIKYFIEHHNYNTIFFESGIEDVFTALNSDRLNVKQKLKESIFSVWHTKEFLDFFNYLIENKIQIYGFDVQNSLLSNNEYYDVFFSSNNTLKENFATIDSLIYSFLIKYNAKLLKNISEEELVLRTKELMADSAFILSKLNKLSQYETLLETKEQVFWYRLILENRKNEVRYQKPYFSSYRSRDSIMASNIHQLLEINNGKCLVWAHNSHIAKVKGFGQFDMGLRLITLAKNYKTHIMGFYAGKGKHLFNDNTIDDFIETDTSFMENKLAEILNEDVGLFYTNNSQVKWFKRKVNTLYFGSITEQIIPFKRYDSIFFIKEVSAMKRLK